MDVSHRSVDAAQAGRHRHHGLDRAIPEISSSLRCLCRTITPARNRKHLLSSGRESAARATISFTERLVRGAWSAGSCSPACLCRVFGAPCRSGTRARSGWRSSQTRRSGQHEARARPVRTRSYSSPRRAGAQSERLRAESGRRVPASRYRAYAPVQISIPKNSVNAPVPSLHVIGTPPFGVFALLWNTPQKFNPPPEQCRLQIFCGNSATVAGHSSLETPVPVHSAALRINHSTSTSRRMRGLPRPQHRGVL